MVFTSLPAYLDTSNWQQQPNNNQLLTGSSTGATSHLLPPPPPPPPPPQPQPQVPHGSGGGGGAGSIRPGSMADRARLANISMPETALKCPRCESTNTKFCYFNNYSLSQPRHFCKTCRRYWTRGGALRNVPVGGGCRRNKRSKSNKSSSPVTGDHPMGSSSSGTVSSNSGTSLEHHHILGIGPVPLPPPPSLRFMAPLHHHLTEFSGGGDHLGLNYAALGSTHHDLNFQVGNVLANAGLGGIVGAGDSGGSGGTLLSMAAGGGGLEQQWRQQFAFMGHGFDSSSPSSSSTYGLYPFEGGSLETSGYGQVRPKSNISTNSVTTQFASVKMEDNQELALSRQFSSVINPANQEHHYWVGASGTHANTAWTDLSSFSSSSTSNPL